MSLIISQDILVGVYALKYISEFPFKCMGILHISYCSLFITPEPCVSQTFLIECILLDVMHEVQALLDPHVKTT
jgi:hypothetical protein